MLQIAIDHAGLGIGAHDRAAGIVRRLIRHDVEVAPPRHRRAEDRRLHRLRDLGRFAGDESRELPVYYLVIAKGGPKLKEATSGETDANGAHAGMMRMTRGQLTGHTVAISNILSALTQITGRTVLDKTGLSGRYDVKLTWTPDEPAAIPGSDGAGQTASTTSESGPSIFTAIQDQLGLKLESGKGPVDCLVVDHVAPPSEN